MSKKFFEQFDKYSPGESLRIILENALVQDTKVLDQSKKIVQATLACDAVLSKDDVAAIEVGLTAAYGLGGIRLLTRYPSEAFTSDYMSEIFKEAGRTGTVVRGFFDDATWVIDDGKINVTISHGLDEQWQRDTATLFERIIKSEFNLDFEVKITRAERNAPSFEELNSMVQSELRTQYAIERQEALKRQAEAPAVVEEAIVPKQTSVSGEVALPEGDEDRSALRRGALVFDLSEPELLLGKKSPTELPVPIARAGSIEGGITICGVVIEYDVRDLRNSSKKMLNISLSDKNGSIMVRAGLAPEELESIEAVLKKHSTDVMRGIRKVVTLYDIALYVRGSIKIDNFTAEKYVDASAISIVKIVPRMDNAPAKRVELHMHTNFSQMDSVLFPEVAAKQAQDWGWSAVGVTDHGTVQAYPLMMEATEKSDIKVLYGLEAYLVDDAARIVFGESDCRFREDEFVIFDIETTGFSPVNDRITEIGAVRWKNGEVLETFSTFVDPGVKIPARITEITGITDEMVVGAPSQSQAVAMFLDFCNSATVVAHNASFDMGFIRHVCEKKGLTAPMTYIDTVAMSRYVNTELQRHKLDNVAKHFGITNFGHHRADADAAVLATIFDKMTAKLADESVRTLGELNLAITERADPKRMTSYHAVIFAKNQAGLKKLYELVSASYLDYYYRNPRIPKSMLEDGRENLVLGSGCEAGELYSAILQNKPHDELLKIAEFYDYLEIHPLCNNEFLVDNGRVASVEELKEINRKICEIGREVVRPVCAVTDAHYLNPEDEIFRKILLAGMKFSDAQRDMGLYLRTTEEMLAEFDYLGEELAYEVVVTNTNQIADSIDKLRPIPKELFLPKMPGATEELQELCRNRAAEMYGSPLPEVVESRLGRELDDVVKHGYAALYLISHKMVAESERRGYLVGSRGSVGSSFVAMMASISEVNPLPPHYRCPRCRYSDFSNENGARSGFDLPKKACPKCETKLISDGQDIPFETFLGFFGDKIPDIDLNFSGEIQGEIHKYTEELFGSDSVYRAGTIGTLASKTAYGFVMKYLDDRQVAVNRAEVNRLVSGCLGTKRTTGQHPGGMIVIPDGMDVHDFSPVQHPADDTSSDVRTTHFAFTYLQDTLLKLDALGHDIPTKYKWLERYSSIPIADIPMDDPLVYELFRTPRPLGVSAQDIDVPVGTLALPEMGTRFVMRLLEEAQPTNFADLVQISALSHGTDVWAGNAQKLIKDGVATISEVIGPRDDIMLTLIRYGLENRMAFDITESVRRGRGLRDEWVEAMRLKGVPDWYIESCKMIKYLFPKAHAAAYVMGAIRVGWYKVHKPMEFYAAYFSVAPDGFDAASLLRGRDSVRSTMALLNGKMREKAATKKDEDTLGALLIVNESLARGVQYLMPDLYKSDARAFLPEDGKIRLPLLSMNGLGGVAADNIIAERDIEPFFSRQELQQRARLNKTVMEVLDKNGLLDGMDETNQMSLF